MFSVNGRYQTHARPTGMQRYAAELVARFSSGPRVIAPHGQLLGLRGHLWEQTVLPSQMGGQLLWSPCGTGPIATSRHVVTVHDIIPIDHPEWFNSSFAALHSWLVPQLARRVRQIITISEYTKQRLMRRLKIRPEMITVIPNGVGEEYFPRSQKEIAHVRRKLGIPEGPYVLSVGSLEPRKNLGGLLEAWSQLEPGREASLVLTGASGSSSVFRDPGLAVPSSRVMFTGYVEECDLPALYSGAACFVYPSLCEGFGLPVLEAFACGAPVVTSNLASLPEVTGSAAVLVDPNSPAEIAAAVARILDSPGESEHLANAGRARAQQYTWARCAAATENLVLSLS